MFLQKMARMTQEFPAMVRRAMALKRENWVEDGGGEGIYDALCHLQMILCDCKPIPTICEQQALYTGQVTDAEVPLLVELTSLSRSHK